MPTSAVTHIIEELKVFEEAYMRNIDNTALERAHSLGKAMAFRHAWMMLENAMNDLKKTNRLYIYVSF
jgi:hypothetical protein